MVVWNSLCHCNRKRNISRKHPSLVINSVTTAFHFAHRPFAGGITLSSGTAATAPQKGRTAVGEVLFCNTSDLLCCQIWQCTGTAGYKATPSPSRRQLPLTAGVMECSTYLLSLFRLSVGCWYCPFILLSLLQHTHTKIQSLTAVPSQTQQIALTRHAAWLLNAGPYCSQAAKG